MPSTEQEIPYGIEQQLVALGVDAQDAATAAMGLFLLARVEKPEGFRKAIDTIIHAESFGPFIDPTAFMRANPETARRNKALLTRVADLLEELNKQKAALTAEGKIG